jgi:capsular polysaccharide biosynthesis protein
MSLLKQFIPLSLWKPRGCVPALESLEAADCVMSKRDMTLPVAGHESPHRLIVVELMNGRIVGDLRMVATAGDIVVGGLQSLFGCPDPQSHYLLRRKRLRMLKRWRGTALLLGTANSDNYYHWLLDSVPRWKMLQPVNDRANYDYVLLPGHSSPFQDEVLDRLNVPEAKRLHCSKNFIHQFDRLFVPSMPFPLEEVSAWACAYVRSLFPEKATGPEKIYLRRGAGRRQLTNETELESALKNLGFVSIQPDQLSVAEQASQLSSARCVVAPHGAALTNLLFAPPGALLLELFHPQHKNRCYVNLAAACGHRYASLDGLPTNQTGDKELEYHVDVPAVLQVIAANG